MFTKSSSTALQTHGPETAHADKHEVNLKSLGVDLTNAYCSNALCRPLGNVISLLNRYVPYPENALGFYVTVMEW